MTLQRKLSYKDRYILQLTEVVNESIDPDALATFPDQTTPIELTVSWTQEQYTRILSALCVGAELAFPYQAQQIYYDFLKILNGGAMSCDDVADCIDSSETVQNAITTNYNIMLQILMQQANSGTGEIPAIESESSTIFNTPFAAGSAGVVDEPIKDLENCNLNKLWAGIRDGIVQRLDDNARSMLEFLVTKADLAERATALIGAIPIFGSMAQAVLDQMVEAAPDMLNLFDSYSSIENMDTIACEIFGIVCSECRYPTMEEVYSYYATFGITGMNDLDNIVVSAATDLLFGSTELVALAFYHTMIAYQLFILLLGSKFHGATGTDAIIRYATLGEDSANDNWEVLCETCNEAYRKKTWDLTASKTDTDVTWGYSIGGAGIWIAGQGWVMAAINNTDGISTIGLQLDPTWTIRAVGIKTSAATGSNNLTAHWRTVRASATGQVGLSFSWGTTGYTWFVNGFASLTGYRELGIRYADSLANNRAIEAITIIFDAANAPSDAVPVASPTLSGTVFP